MNLRRLLACLIVAAVCLLPGAHAIAPPGGNSPWYQPYPLSQAYAFSYEIVGNNEAQVISAGFGNVTDWFEMGYCFGAANSLLLIYPSLNQSNVIAGDPYSTPKPYAMTLANQGLYIQLSSIQASYAATFAAYPATAEYFTYRQAYYAAIADVIAVNCTQ